MEEVVRGLRVRMRGRQVERVVKMVKEKGL